MVITSEKKVDDLRKNLSIELCDNFIHRLNPEQTKEVKIGALIAIRNLIKESNIYDPFLYSYLVDTLTDLDKEVRKIVIKVIKEVSNSEIIELMEIKLQESKNEIKTEISNLLKSLRTK